MGRRGTKPTPTALHVLRGNPGKRDLNEHEPQHPALDALQLPPEIADNVIAAGEWRRLAPGLAACGQLTVADRAVMIGYCVKYAHWREREKLAAAEPYLIRGQRGTMVHPAIKIADAAFLIFMRAAIEIGLTPSSRSRIVAQKPAAPVSKWSGALK